MPGGDMGAPPPSVVTIPADNADAMATGPALPPSSSVAAAANAVSVD